MAFTRDELEAGFRLGHCLIQPSHNRVVREDAEVHVEPRAMDVLVCLAEHAGEVVSRDALFEAVWGRVVVTDQALTNCVSELRHHLGDDRAANRLIETIPKRGYRLIAPVEIDRAIPAADAPPPQRARAMARRRRLLAGGAALLGAVLVIVFVGSPTTTGGSPTTSIIVVPFENAAGNENLDYLRLALSDEIATLLTRSPDLAVRPFEYLNSVDPVAEARSHRAGHVVRGRYYLEEGDRLTVAVEAQHVDQERVIWRALITAPVDDLRAMRGRMANRVHQGLLPALGVPAGPSFGSSPAHEEAYQLYLRTLALPKQPRPTERAIEMLERAVELDPGFAPAWNALGLRYYEHGTYGTGAEWARQQSLAAQQKALELDPELISAARQIVIHQTESGHLDAAYRRARRLVERRGSASEAHFALAYVYRFGGLLQASQRHCELALDRDPHEPRLRSCGYSYLYAGELSRVMDFLELDEGSYFVNWGTVLYHLRRRDDEAALAFARQSALDPTRHLMEPCLEGARGAALDQAVAEFVRFWHRHGEPEAAYAVAPMLEYCGRRDEALRFVERAVDGNFCAYPALDQDPVWAGLREHPEFERIRRKAIACHERFRRAVEAHAEQGGDRPS